MSSTGLVTAVAPGRVVVTANAGGKSGATVVRAAVTKDVAVTDAQFTQGIQAAGGIFPIVLAGDAGVLNVRVRTSRSEIVSP